MWFVVLVFKLLWCFSIHVRWLGLTQFEAGGPRNMSLSPGVLTVTPQEDSNMSLSPERPEVSLLQSRPSSPVVCHATGFYPDRVVVFWTRDGQELYEHVDHGEVLPNLDGTFQVSVDLDLASVPREDWRRYECVVQLKGIEDISTRLDPALGSRVTSPPPIIIGCVVLLLAVVAVAVGVFVYKKRNGV
ncbi:Major histocompatibility complex class I-related gene protein [Merluccius polli]|uniref:Major histocompatibility complex class I-related gene protein n=1 Tax=Merluccius polli TaxID=89951 RepID=A0AA47M9T1_MERPO|nr:Major histocompatibility complex class I-related gene protein [Merluccius polli]